MKMVRTDNEVGPMTRANWLLFLTLTFPVANAGAAEPETGEQLLNQCRVYTQLAPMPWGFKVIDSNTDAAACLTFMQTLTAAAVTGAENRVYCLPRDITQGQLAAAFVTFADLNPDLLKQDAGSAAGAVLGKAYPCKGHP
jgi:hypothetical protein